MRLCRKGQDVVRTELGIQRADGTEVPVDMVTQRSAANTELTYKTVVVDLTERVRFERERLDAEMEREQLQREEQVARRSSEAKDRFLAVLSHELRTPLTPVLFAVARLEQMPAMPSAARTLLDVIRRNLNLEAQLIADLLDMNRIALSKLVLDLADGDAHDIAREAISVLEWQFQERGITLTLALDAIESRVLADGQRLRQVFWNLLTNALKFTDRGGEVRVTSSNPVPERLIIAVEDTGVGIQPEEIGRLFEPFEQNARGDAALGGLGLGLTICRGIVDAHHGVIRASSDGAGHGTRFEVELDTVRRDELVTASAEPSPSADTA
jgi:signal transduction histidine kinase